MVTISTLPLSEVAAIGARSLVAGRYSSLAVYVLQVYEWFLTLDDEIELIHKSRWTSIKAAYLVCRYYPIIVYPVCLWAWLGDHTPELCARLVHPLYSLLVPFQLSAQAVILIRTHAFTGRNKIVLAILCGCYLILLSAEVWLFGTRFIVVDILYKLLGDSGCFANDAEVELGKPLQYTRATETGAVMMGAFGLDLIMTLTVILHCFRIRTTQGELGRTFMTQGFFAFLVVSGVNLLTAILYLGPNRQYDGVGLPFALVLSDVLACRLILLLRRKVSPTPSLELELHSRIVREGLRSPNPDIEEASDTDSDSVDHWVC